MLSVWKLMGGFGVILSICWMPAWMAEISLSRPRRSSMAVVVVAGEAPSGKDAALDGTATGAWGGVVGWQMARAHLTESFSPASIFCFASSISFFFSSNTTWKRSLMATTT